LLKTEYPSDSVRYIYDAAGNLLQVNDADSRIVMTYDQNGQLLTATTGDSSIPINIQPVTTIEYQYDVAGRKVKMINPNSDTTHYYYDSIGLLDSLKTPGVFSYETDKLGRVTKLSRPNSTTTDYQYDQSSRILSIIHRNGVVLIDSLDYSYNPVGMVSSIVNGTDSVQYGYDGADQLISAVYSDTLFADEFFTYDSLGNRTSSHLSSSYIYDAANQIQEDDQFTYTFDDNGNLIVKEDKSSLDRWEYGYNFENRLISVEKYDGGVSPPSLKFGYSYDGLDRRIAVIVNSDTTTYIYDDQNFLLEHNGSDSVGASYVNGLQIDQPLEVTRRDSSYYYHTDRLGSIIGLTDENGNLVQDFSYGSFGKIVNKKTDKYFSPFAYTSREWERGSEQYFYRARYYDSNVGRFLSLDPLGFVDGINLFAYVLNNPSNYTDPMGLAHLHTGCMLICFGLDGLANFVHSKAQDFTIGEIGRYSHRQSKKFSDAANQHVIKRIIEKGGKHTHYKKSSIWRGLTKTSSKYARIGTLAAKANFLFNIAQFLACTCICTVPDPDDMLCPRAKSDKSGYLYLPSEDRWIKMPELPAL
jgi:RHS repeat-associated protein